MEKKYTFAVDDVQHIQLEDYAEDEFCIAKMGFLSTRPNSHGLIISEEVLRESAPTILNKWLVADMTAVYDAGTHTPREQIVGRIPDNQQVEFVTDEDGYLRAYVDVVISKIYAKNFCAMFERNNNRAVSVEMLTWGKENNEDDLESFRIVGCTVLGMTTAPSCPQSDITFTRFSAEEADNFFAQTVGGLTDLNKFVKQRKQAMSKAYKVDKSKEAMSDDDWSAVDKTALRNKILEASNSASLVKDVYLLIESNWKDAPSEALKYPVMGFKGDTLVYYRRALASALAYAKKENETAVVSKINKIYKKLGLDSEGKEETEMSEEEKKLSEQEEMSCKENMSKEEEKENTDSANEEKKDNEEKSAEMSEDESKPEEEKDDGEDEKKEEMSEESAEMSAEEMMAELARLQKDVEEKENIIMEKDKKLSEQEAELSDLREFKCGVEKEKQTMSVEKVMSEVKDFVDATKFAELRDEGLACDAENFDAWSNKVKATCFSAIQKKGLKKQTNTVWSFSAPNEPQNNEPTDFWSQMKSKYN